MIVWCMSGPRRKFSALCENGMSVSIQSQQEDQLSQKGRATLRVVEILSSLIITHDHSNLHR